MPDWLARQLDQAREDIREGRTLDLDTAVGKLRQDMEALRAKRNPDRH